MEILDPGDGPSRLRHDQLADFSRWLNQGGKFELKQVDTSTVYIAHLASKRGTAMRYSPSTKTYIADNSFQESLLRAFLDGEEPAEFFKESPTQPKGNTMSDKNAAAMLRQDTRTIKVRFNNGDKDYTYVTDLNNLQVGDLVVVPVTSGGINQMATATVSEVHDDLEIQPKENTTYKWVVQRVDMEAYKSNMDKNAMIEDTVRNHYRQASRSSFAQQLLAGLPEGQRGEIQNLLGMAKG